MSTEIEIVGYLRASPEGKPEWSEDCVCVDAVYPNYDGDESVSMPICRLADAQAIIAQRDARISELEATKLHGEMVMLRTDRDRLAAELKYTIAAYVTGNKPSGVADERAAFDAWFDQFGVGSALYPESTWQGWQARARLNPCRAQSVLDLGQAATDVIAERKRQITEEGWTPGHDDRHTCGELADAAACYALWGGGSSPHNFDQFWPWGMSRLKFGQARQMLIKSGALILAEIERLDRAAAPSAKKES